MLALETVIHLSQILGGKITDDGVKVAQKHLFGPDIWRKKKVERISVCTLLKRLICGHTIINDGNPQHNINPYWGKSEVFITFSFQLWLDTLVNRYSDLVYNNNI